MWIADRWEDYELLDCGGGERLERWGRQVRRMCAESGLEVERLRRVREHTLELGELPPGKWRRLTEEELEALRS